MARHFKSGDIVVICNPSLVNYGYIGRVDIQNNCFGNITCDVVFKDGVVSRTFSNKNIRSATKNEIFLYKNSDKAVKASVDHKGEWFVARLDDGTLEMITEKGTNQAEAQRVMEEKINYIRTLDNGEESLINYPLYLMKIMKRSRVIPSRVEID